MQPLFSTEGLHPSAGFKLWRELLSERLVPIEVARLDADGPKASSTSPKSVPSTSRA